MLLNREKLIMLQNLSLIHGDLPGGFAIIILNKHVVKNQPLICFKMMLPYILNLIGNEKMWLTFFGLQ